MSFRIKATLWQKEVEDRHKTFQRDLEEWSKLNDKVLLGLRTKLYKRAWYVIISLDLANSA